MNILFYIPQVQMMFIIALVVVLMFNVIAMSIVLALDNVE